MDLLLGVDGGGTRTRALLATEEGTVLGYGEAGGSNRNNVGWDRSIDQIRKATAKAFQQAGMDPVPVHSAVLGIAGIDTRRDRVEGSRLASEARISIPGGTSAVNDVETALAGGLTGRPGIALIAGTGSNCCGRDASGAQEFCGGWGWRLDDVGSGYFLGLRCLQEVVRSLDGRAEHTTLSAPILEWADVEDPKDIIRVIYVESMSADRIASLAPLVIAHAEAGDAIANKLVCEGVDGLVDMVRATAKGLKWSGQLEVALIGGLALSTGIYGTSLRSGIERAIPGARALAPELPPVCGAVLLAAEKHGLPSAFGRVLAETFLSNPAHA